MNYYLMHKDTLVCNIELDELSNIVGVDSIVSDVNLPLGVRENDFVHTLNIWWKNRSIPKSRSGLKKALDSLNLTVSQELIDKCLGLSLSDQYWICPQGKNIKWKNVNFFDNDFSEDIGNLLFGSKISSEKIDFMSPDSTSDGQLKKKWKIIDGNRCLIKGGSAPYFQEPLNEVIASCLMDKLGIPHIEYNLIWDDDLPYSVCRDFVTNTTELVSAYQICASNENISDSMYDHFMDCSKRLGIPNVQKSIDEMLVVDFLIANVDRHYGNFGAIRNADTLEFLGMAPLFDNGTSLWHNTLDDFINPNADIESSTFCDKLKQQLEYVTDFSFVDFEKLDSFIDEANNIFSSSKYITENRKQFLLEAINTRIEILKSYVENR